MAIYNVSASISPDNVAYEKQPGECYNVLKTVEIPEVSLKVDILFSFDVTNSMSEILNEANQNISKIMNNLILNYNGVSFNFGVISYSDYPVFYSSYCDYTNGYGVPTVDYAYYLNQPLTSDTSEVTSALNSLNLGNGFDAPDDYTRIFYESYNDLNIGWRTESQKILINFADSIPHDCNLNEGIFDGTWSTGGDPGPDEIMNTDDDLDLQEVLAIMNSNDITLIECHSSTNYLDYWEYWTGITGGSVNYTTTSNFVDVVEDAITNKLVIPKIYGLHLQVTTPGYESWLYSVTPSSYPELSMGAIVTFEETICVPVDTTPDEYTFIVSAVDGVGNNYGDQTNVVTIYVDTNDPPYAPTTPNPTDGATGINTNPSLRVLVDDPEGDLLNVSFYDDEDNLIGVDTNVPSGDTASISWSGRSYSKTYSWYAVANDSENSTISNTWSFTTKSAPTPPPPENNDPIADASAGAPYFGVVGESITFDGSNSYDPDTDGYIVSWHWDFGDNTEGVGETTTHSYSSNGTYSVTLKVIDNEGAEDQVTFDVIILTANHPPKNLIVDGPLTGKKNIYYTYTASATDLDIDDMLRYIFDWDDGTTTTSDVVASGITVSESHNWSTYGVYEVTVTVLDNLSASDSTTLTVLIDVIVIDGDIKGYIIDEDSTDPFDIFNNSDTRDETDVEKEERGAYLIDSDEDGVWDHAYDPEWGLLNYSEYVIRKYQEIFQIRNATPGFELISLLAMIALISIILKRRRKK